MRYPDTVSGAGNAVRLQAETKLIGNGGTSVEVPLREAVRASSELDRAYGCAGTSRKRLLIVGILLRDHLRAAIMLHIRALHGNPLVSTTHSRMLLGVHQPCTQAWQ